MESNRVVIADDDVLVREGVASLLRQGPFEVVGQAGDATELMRLVRDERPDLVVLDIRMPPTHTTEGLDAAQAIRAEWPRVGILVLSAHVEANRAMDLLAEGRSNSGIATRLFVTEGAVEKHVRSILAKLRLPVTEDDHRRVLAVVTFLGAR
jgi:DNA-binding NarL/FixJ family response regulator